MKRLSTRWRMGIFNNISETDTVVDLGACVGYTTNIFAKRAIKGIVISVEPVYENYKKLLNVILKQGYKNVLPIFGGISNKTTLSTIYVSDLEETHSTWWQDRFNIHSSVQRPMVVFSWDDLMDMLVLKKVDFLKIDVNGAEIEVFEGMSKVLPERILLEDSSKIRPMSYFFKDKKFNARLLSLVAEKGYKIKETVKYWYLLER